jgi:hypothetical protein
MTYIVDYVHKVASSSNCKSISKIVEYCLHWTYWSGLLRQIIFINNAPPPLAASTPFAAGRSPGGQKSNLSVGQTCISYLTWSKDVKDLLRRLRASPKDESYPRRLRRLRLRRLRRLMYQVLHTWVALSRLSRRDQDRLARDEVSGVTS